MQRNKVFCVRFFIQRGLATGGLDASETVIATNEQEAIKKVEAQMANQGGQFIFVSVTEEGAQG